MNFFCHVCDEHRDSGQIEQTDDGTYRCKTCNEDYVEIVDDADPPQQPDPSPAQQPQPQDPFANFFGPNVQSQVHQGPNGSTFVYSFNHNGMQGQAANPFGQLFFGGMGQPPPQPQQGHGQPPQQQFFQPQFQPLLFPFGQMPPGQQPPGQNGEGFQDPIMGMLQRTLGLFGMHANQFQFGGGGRNLNDILHDLLMNSGNSGPPPASTDLIESLEEIEIDQHYRETAEATNRPTHCAICQDEFADGDKCRVMPCKHTYHNECIERWLSMHNSCPVCRLTLTEQQLANDAAAAPGEPSAPSAPESAGPPPAI